MTVCVLDRGHTGRCRDTHGTTWEHDHPDCETCALYGAWARDAMERAATAEAALAELRSAVRAVLAAGADEVRQLAMMEET